MGTKSNKFTGGSNPHHGSSISQSGQQRYGQGPKPGQGGQSGSPYSSGGAQPSSAEKRRQAMGHGGSHKNK